MKLFYSYSAKDETARSELESHLSLLRREGFLATWSFRDIDAGEEWKKTIDRRLEESNIVLLLVTANFLASPYCMDIEMKRAIERADARELLLLPIIVKPCDWKTAPFARFQVLPTGGKPVSSWRPRDLAWADTASGIRAAIASRDGAQKRLVLGKQATSSETESVRAAAAKLQRDADRKRRFDAEDETAFRTAVQQLFATLERAVEHAREAAPSLNLTIAVEESRRVIRTPVAYLNLEVGFRHVETWFYFAQRRYFKFLFPWEHIRWVPTIYHYWIMRISPDSELWEWHDFDGDQCRPEEFADYLINCLLHVCAAVSQGETPHKAKNLPVTSIMMIRH